MTLRSKGITAIKWYSAASICITVFQLLQFIIVSRILEPSDYGLMAMIMAIVNISMGFCDMGFSNAIIQRQEISNNHLSSLYILNIMISSAVCLTVWLLAPLIAWFYQEPRLVELVHWMAFICVIPAIGQQFQILYQKEITFDATTKVEILSQIVSVLVAVVGAYMGYGVYALVWSFLVNVSVKSAGLVIIGLRIWKPTLHFSWTDVKEYMSFGIYQTGTSVLNTVNSRLDYLILGSTLGAEALGYYMFAYQLCMLPMQKLNPMIWQVSLPIYAKIQNQMDLLRKGYFQMMGMISYISPPIFFGLMVTAHVFVPLVFGAQWKPSIMIVQALSGVMLMQSLTTSSSLLAAKGQVNITFKFTLISLFIQLPGLAIGAYMGDVMGVAIAYLIVQACLFVIHYLFIIRRILGPCLRQYLGCMAQGLLCSSIMALCVLLINQFVSFDSEFIRLSIQVGAGVLLYVAIVYYFERDLLRSLLKMRAGKKSLTNQ
ncbi:MOP flippase family protein [Cohnella terricola]|uniref:MOP flippase family protein n=1 Tax=Cohnella terricola TaxID=1289167 RepID=A0A559JML8_9BACL|nr:MOP flippase family protein [Cohnella terricola]TVY01122.1 MOP flippase family protein [Cohnella terricola]